MYKPVMLMLMLVVESFSLNRYKLISVFSSWSILAESMAVEDVVEMADYKKGDMCKHEEVIEVEEKDGEGLDEIIFNKIEL